MTAASFFRRRRLISLLVTAAMVALGAGSAMLGLCGPFNDVAPDAFCPFVLEVFPAAITTGLTATTYDPDGSVTRLQMAAFLSRSVDRTLQRASRRAALEQFWTTQGPYNVGITNLGYTPRFVKSDGTDL